MQRRKPGRGVRCPLCRCFASEICHLDGEIVCLDRYGKSQFYSLMFRRGPARFYAFDILELDGGDLRSLPLLKRMRHLKRLISAPRSALLYVDHIIGKGEHLFRLCVP